MQKNSIPTATQQRSSGAAMVTPRTANCSRPPAHRGMRAVVWILCLGVAAALSPTLAAQATPSETPFWHQLNDPVLNDLVAQALHDNRDMDAARARIEQAQAVAAQHLAPLLPAVWLEGSWRWGAYNRVGPGVTLPASQGLVDNPDTQHNLSAVLKASYVVDLAARQTALRKAALEEARAAAEDANALALTLVTQVIQAYYDAVSAHIRVQVIDAQIHSNAQLLELLETRFQAGTSSALEVLQQRQLLAATRANRPLVLALHETSLRQLAVLIGAADHRQLPALPASLPDIAVPDEAPPGEAVDHLPHLRAAQLRSAALQHRAKSAKRALMPSLSLTGQVGWMANYGNRFDDGENWNIGALLSVPLYQGGALRAQKHAADAAARAQEHSLQAAQLAAVAKADIAHAQAQGHRARLDALRQQQEVATTVLEQAKNNYLVGLADYLNVLSALNGLQAVELSALQAERDVVDAHVQFLSALGGDWSRHMLFVEGENP
ncbi:MAG: TolC family protein [Proteobacteria bacterium]|nr:TolC family protein [Pseudomonadota bacterium]